MDFGVFSEILKVVLQICQVIALGYAGYKFTRRPHDTLESKFEALEKRVDVHDTEIKELRLTVRHGAKKQGKTNKAFITIMLAFVDFEVSYCLNTGYEKNEDLLRTRKLLQDYVSDDDMDENE